MISPFLNNDSPRFVLPLSRENRMRNIKLTLAAQLLLILFILLAFVQWFTRPV